MCKPTTQDSTHASKDINKTLLHNNESTSLFNYFKHEIICTCNLQFYFPLVRCSEVIISHAQVLAGVLELCAHYLQRAVEMKLKKEMKGL